MSTNYTIKFNGNISGCYEDLEFVAETDKAAREIALKQQSDGDEAMQQYIGNVDAELRETRDNNERVALFRKLHELRCEYDDIAMQLLKEVEDAEDPDYVYDVEIDF